MHAVGTVVEKLYSPSPFNALSKTAEPRALYIFPNFCDASGPDRNEPCEGDFHDTAGIPAEGCL
jgi:hypothetical protein